MYNNSKVAKAIRLAMMFGAGAAATISAPAFSADEGAEDVERIQVTGSRIKRTDMEQSSPVQVITGEEMVNLGRISVADALRSSTANSFGSVVPSSGGSWQSQATVDLLGLGASRTLVLLDGKRLPGSPTMGGSSVNINQIPMAIVERIEILKGGASAVYGSDAISGVVNIILKKNYEGLEINANQTFADDEGGESSDFSFVTGISSDKGNITFAYEHQEQDPIFDRDRPYTAPSWVDTDGDGAYDQTVGVSQYGASIKNPNTGLWEASPECDNLAANVPGFVGVIESSAASENRYCGFAYAGVSANQASTNRDSIFVNGTYEISENVEFFARAIFTHNESFGRYAPPAAPWLGGVPANSTHNPYDEPASGKFRWYEIGNRDGNVSDYSQDYIAGLTGTLGDMFDYEVYYHHNTTDNKSVGEFYLSYSGLFYNIYAGIPLDEGVDNMKATTLTQDYNRFDQFYAGVGFELGDLGAGAIGHYFGFETFDIKYASIVDAQSEAGLIGGSSGNSAGKSRDIKAVFYETIIPVVDGLELEFAIRYDDYSDFGSEVSPKLAATYRPVDDLMIRASWGKGFRAPSLQQLSQADSYAADYATDYVGCASVGVPASECTEEQYDTTRQANPNLDAETSTFINLGVVWDWEGLNLTADYFDVEIEDAIRFVPIQDLVNGEYAGAENPDPSLLSIDRETNGFESPIFRTSTINGPGLDVSGLNVNVNYFLETNGAGSIRFNSETTYFIEWNQDNYAGGPMQDKSGWELQPEYRTQFTTTYLIGDHSIAWNIDYIPSTSGFESPDPENPASGILVTNGKNDSFMTHNLTYTYDAGAWGRYRLGVRNLTDEDPILNSTGEYADGYDYLYSAGHMGRMYSIGGTWTF
ncbi:TonB-dependent receptor plug domain-containing protein [Litorilituus sediminis]|uniref:TonB-dependent receptor n=1 Tax=Litorilituus sediminis TaxID=718192 RepID=A0A4V0ZGI8_9GAMM|nr:TonB-dependent receptor [Litorilituus sediminis]QBG37450.1 TonB-dependent receptor [Litorilituus sediminis]